MQFKKILNLTSFCLAFFSFQLTAFGLTVSPAIDELIINPGETKSYIITITNEEETPKDFYVSSQNFEPQGESGTPYFTTTNEGLASWITAPAQVSIQPKETIEVTYSVDVPAETAPGGYFASVFFSTQPPVNSEVLDANSQVSIGGKVGVLVLLRVAGDIDEDGGIIEFGSEDGKSFFKGKPINFMYRFNNDGGDRVSPQGTITVKNLFGFTTDTLLVNEQKSNVLPGSIRKFTYLWGTALPASQDAFLPDLLNTLKYQVQNFHLGVYTATLDLEWGFNVDQTGTKDFTFYVFPTELMILVLLLILILIFGVKLYNRWIISNAIKAMKAANLATKESTEETLEVVVAKQAKAETSKKPKAKSSTKKLKAEPAEKANSKAKKSSKTSAKKEKPKKPKA